MIKNILFITSLIAVSAASAQTFQINDHNDVDITNTIHYEYGTPATLGFTKFHVKNLTGTNQNFAAKVEKIYVPYSNSGLAVCFGTACYSASATVSGTQIINGGIGDEVVANGIYTNFKSSPITWPWVNTIADSATWKIVIFNELDVSDAVTVTVIWKFRLIGDTDGDGVIGAGEVAGDIDGNGIIDGSEIEGDVTGDGIIGAGELEGDSNGNGVIDNGESAVSVNEIDVKNINIKAYPNPATDNLTVAYDLNGKANHVTISVYDILGQNVTSKKLNNSKGLVQLDLQNVNAGIYFYTIKVEDKVLRTEKFIVR